MRTMKCLKVVLGGVLLAATAYVILAAPGFLTDEASTVPIHQQIAPVPP
jgi:hypothetical protein